MSVLNLDTFPEIIAAFAFCPIGFAFAFILHATPISFLISSGFEDVVWGPYAAIIVCAIISCIIMQIVKLVNQSYKFEHFYLILIGLLITLISGISMFLVETHNEVRIFMYTVGPGIGFIYVPGLAYIHARAKDFRHLKLSLCHIFYIIGFILGTVIISQYTRNEAVTMLQIYGYVLTAITIVAILLIVINEILQYMYKTYFNYKQPTDYNMDYENKFKTIFLKTFFKNVSQSADINLNNYKLNPLKLAGYVIFLIIIKLIGLTFFYYPMVFINFAVISGYDLYYCYLISIIGLILSTILLQFIKIKTNLIVSLILKIISFLILILFSNLFDEGAEELKIFYWIHVIFLLYGFNVHDIVILELTKLQYTEIVLTIGLVLEMLVNGILHYFVVTSTESIINIESLAQALLEHVIPIVIVLLLILFVTIIILPETLNNSVLEIQNIMFFKVYDKKANGSGTSIQQKEPPIQYDPRQPPPDYVKTVNAEHDDRMPPNSRFRPHQIQTLSMSSSTATSEFNYRNHHNINEPYPQKAAVIQRQPPTPEEPYYDYNQVKPTLILPRVRPTSNGFDPFNR